MSYWTSGVAGRCSAHKVALCAYGQCWSRICTLTHIWAKLNFLPKLQISTWVSKLAVWLHKKRTDTHKHTRARSSPFWPALGLDEKISVLLAFTDTIYKNHVKPLIRALYKITSDYSVLKMRPGGSHSLFITTSEFLYDHISSAEASTRSYQLGGEPVVLMEKKNQSVSLYSLLQFYLFWIVWNWFDWSCPSSSLSSDTTDMTPNDTRPQKHQPGRISEEWFDHILMEGSSWGRI